MLVKCNSKIHSSSKRKRGDGFVNSLINKLLLELHIPGYKYCGPGTKLAKRLVRGDIGINKLDEPCKQHDIAYDKEKNLGGRHSADRILLEEAKKRLQSSDASWGEKAAALGVAAVMKAKVKLGMGCKTKNRKKKKSNKRIKRGKTLSFKQITKKAHTALRNKKFGNATEAIKVAVQAIKTAKGKRKIKPVRVIPVPKTGGILPLIPIFAGLSALGALSGGAAGIAKAVNDAKAASQELKEKQRHNRVMEEVTMGKGLHLKPYKQGLGLFLAPNQFSKNYR